VIQCGDNTRTAAGVGSRRPNSASRDPARPGSSAKVGEPCETKSEGSRSKVEFLSHIVDGVALDRARRT
jgi:hypothetical protein